MPYHEITGDITLMESDAIVNAANTELLAGGGVCGAIFRAAGHAELQKACNALSPIRTGEAVITPGFRLKAKYIIHTAGPVYNGGRYGEEELLRSCYRSSLKIAQEHGLKSIAFPLISAGIYGYPYEEALKIAREELEAFCKNNEIDAYLVLFRG